MPACAVSRWVIAGVIGTLLVGSRSAAAQTPLRIDLATLKEKGDTLPIPSGTYIVRLSNRVPRFNYSSQGRAESRPIAPISSGIFDVYGHAMITKAGEGLPAQVPKCPDADSADNKALTKIVAAFDSLRREKEVPALVARANTAVLAAALGKCAATNAAIIAQVNKLIAQTEQEQADTLTVRSSQYLTIAIRRSTTDGKSARAWDVVYGAPNTGGWRTLFGFAVLQTGGLGKSGAFESSRQYFTTAVPNTTDRYVIEEGRGRQLDMVPVVTLTYQADEDPGVNWKGRLSAGLGLDLTNPFLSVGWGWTLYSNLHLNVGLAVRREDVLAAAYRVGDTVRTTLTTQQLMPDRDFRVRPMMSLSFRFASNPFAKPSSGSGTEGKKPAGDTGDKAAGATSAVQGGTNSDARSTAPPDSKR